jgi:F420H(2)-dependent quinone reductase
VEGDTLAHQPKTVVLNHLQDGDWFVVYGTKGGAPTDPDWVRNVLTDASPTIETGTETIPVRAIEITGAPNATSSTRSRSSGDRSSARTPGRPRA